MNKRFNHACKFIYFFSLMMIVCSKSVYAYIDPSTITYLVQAVAAVLIAVGAALTVYRHKIVAFFKGKKNTDGCDEKKKEKDSLENEDGVVDIQVEDN